MTLDDELLLLEQGMKSDFWQLMLGRFRPVEQKLIRQVLDHYDDVDASPTVRDRRCERAAAMGEILNWPTDRLLMLRKKQKELDHASVHS